MSIFGKQGASREELERAISLLNAIIESTGDGILVVCRAGKIVHFNRKFVQMWRIPERVIATRDDDQAIAFVLDQLKQPEKFSSKVRELYDNGDAISYDTLEFKDGRVFERYSQPQKLGDEHVGRVWNFRDITQRTVTAKEKEGLLEIERKARSRAEEAAQMRDELVAMVSHDLKNPLCSILTAVNLIQRAGLLDERGKQPLAMIKRSADHMHQMVQDLLDAYKTEAGGYRVKVEEGRGTYSALAIVKDAIELQQVIAGEKNIRLEMDVSEKLRMISVHAGLIGQVFQNLIGNALKFTPEGGRVRVHAEAIGPDVIFSVEDTGPGLEESLIPMLFDRFAQAKKTATLGTGLGLVIAKGIVEAHDGKIWAESKVGVGTTFFFSIPTGET